MISYSAHVYQSPLHTYKYCLISKFDYKWWSFFIWSGCEELQWRCWWQSVLLMCKSVVTEPFSRLTLRPKNATLFFDDSYVNWRFGKKSIKSLHKRFKFCFSMHPNKKDIVNISQPYKWLKLLRFKKICLSFIHINTGVWRSKLSSNSSTRDLLLNFVVKFKKIVFKNKFC